MKKNLVWSLLVGLVLILSTSTNLMAKSDDGLDQPEAQIPVAFPEVDLVIIDIDIPDDRTPLVTFSITNDNGLPLDRNGVYTDGAVDIRFMLTYIPMGEEQKVNYHDRLRDRDGDYTTIEQGLYTYKFTTVLPEDWEQDATHTLAGVATRDLRNPWELSRYYDNEVYNFIPSGSGMAMPRDVVSTESCNRCHDPLGEHGGRYQEVAV
jgi:OmcA/MtrC family decaheme c-type cytochrome